MPKCACGGLIKPDIVFFGENLPARFFTSAINDFPKCELLVIIGTSLVVQVRLILEIVVLTLIPSRLHP